MALCHKSLLGLWALLVLTWGVAAVEVVELFDDDSDAEAKILAGMSTDSHQHWLIA